MSLHVVYVYIRVKQKCPKCVELLIPGSDIPGGTERESSIYTYVCCCIYTYMLVSVSKYYQFLCASMLVYLCLCQSVSVFMRIYICVSVYFCLCMSIDICVCFLVFMSVDLSCVHENVAVCLCVFVSCVCLHLCTSVYAAVSTAAASR